MKLKQVEIKGFKSLAKKTSLTLADGVTCIAGPNGCGKSNVIDAIRWALGEQSIRSLRAGSMSDVIFSGTQDTYPGSMAQVTLEFVRDGGYFPKSLDGFDEVSITRRLYRTGESLYMINNVKCRLKDVAELFLDTGIDRHGYAIIEQGKVKDIIQSKPEDIRYLIEEVAQVGKFRIKRADAVRRLEATSKNLERIQDLLAEVSRQKNDLRSQANKARRYQVVRSEINELTRLLWVHELNVITEAKKKLDQEKQDLDSQILSFEKQHQEYEHVIKAHSFRRDAIKEKIDSAASALAEARSRALLAKGDMDAGSQRIKDIEATLAMINTRMDQMKDAIQEAEQDYGKVCDELKDLSGNIEAVQAEIGVEQEHIENTLRDYKRIEEEYNQGRTQLFDSIGHSRVVAQRLSSLNTRYQEVISSTRRRAEDLAGIQGRKNDLQTRLEDLDRTLKGTRASLDETENAVRSLNEAQEELRKTIDASAQTLVSREKDYARLTAKISMLERMIKSGAPAASVPSESSNGLKRVSDTLRVAAGFEETVGKSMGEALDFVITEDHEDVCRLLMKGDGDPGYIIKQPHLRKAGDIEPPAGSGVIGPLRNFLDVEQGFEDVATALSKDMWVVEDIRCAVDIWKQGHWSGSLVTRQGIVVEPSGAVRTSVEMTKYAENLKAKAEKEQLAVQARGMEKEIGCEKEDLGRLRGELESLNKQRREATAREDALKKEVVTFMNTRNDILRELDRITERQDSYSRDIAGWEEMAKKLQGDIADISSQKDQAEGEIEKKQRMIKTLDGKRLSAKDLYDTAREGIQAYISRMNELKVLHASKKERSQGIRTNLDKMHKELEKDSLRAGDLMRTKSAVDEAVKKSATKLNDANTEIGEQEEARANLLPEYDELCETLGSLTESRDQSKESMDHLERVRNSCMLKKKEQEIAFSMSLERLESRFGKDLPEVPDSFSPQEAREKVDDLEKRIEKMGQINFASIDAYENVQARWDDLHRQFEDIVQASTRLKEVIANIERESTKAFMATFKQVRTNFQEIFTTIFGGGTADIVLSENEGSETGVEILASPPFKRLKAMSLLSEGEKTLCALSFIFALFKVRPSPFCILDEVDAPLDDANVGRFNRIIRSFAQDSQFLIVTHNRYTMEMADIIYGVTFDVPGITKVVSMILQDMQM